MNWHQIHAWRLPQTRFFKVPRNVDPEGRKTFQAEWKENTTMTATFNSKMKVQVCEFILTKNHSPPPSPRTYKKKNKKTIQEMIKKKKKL